MKIWDALSGKSDREASVDRERRQAERREFYSPYANPSLAEFIGSANICDICFATTPDMPKHLDWHSQMVTVASLTEAADRGTYNG